MWQRLERTDTEADSEIQAHEAWPYNVTRAMNTTTWDTKAAFHRGLGIRWRCSGLDVAGLFTLCTIYAAYAAEEDGALLRHC